MKALKIGSLIIIVMFICLYAATTGGYYEYQLKQQSALTEDAIKKFEEDIKKGKNVDVNSYLDNTNKDYNNGISNFNKKVSGSIEKVFSGTLKYLFKSISDLVDEK